MKIGEAYETSKCCFCGHGVEHIWWGNGSSMWIHRDSKEALCATKSYAAPIPERVVKIGDRP